jgi:lysyl-tRNA synthetase class 1
MIDKEILLASNAWPFVEAKKLLERLDYSLPEKGYVLFETGYGPSGLPHIGTFGEVARSTMVMHAFKVLTNMKMPTKLIAFSDDMDGMRKIPDNLPNPEMLAQHLGQPLTAVPDPFGTHPSFGHHMNAKLQGFLDKFGFEYEFMSATDCYKSGLFDETLLKCLKVYDKIMAVMLPTLGEERQQTYSPFLPICPKSGKVLMVPLTSCDLEAGTITFNDEDGDSVTVPVTGGACKLQWKPDFGMRWAALGVDFEMYGKDHLPNANLYTTICRIIGGAPPSQFVYELFLDEKGQKISKSKGNGITIDEWLTYAPTESLSYYMYQSPKSAKKLHFDVIPKQVDDYLTFIDKYHREDQQKQLQNPVWHIHSGHPPKIEMFGLNYSLLLNLAAVCNPEDKSILWGFISKYAARANPADSPFLDRLVDFAICYYNDFVKPHKQYLTPTEGDVINLNKISQYLSANMAATADEIQTEIYNIGKESQYAELKEFFASLYEILLGQKTGPRLGTLIALYGKAETMRLIENVLKAA